jgi:hypothetical protein
MMNSSESTKRSARGDVSCLSDATLKGILRTISGAIDLLVGRASGT